MTDSRCLRCVTKVELGRNFCDDCATSVKLFLAKNLCWACAADIPPADCTTSVAQFCPTCGEAVTQSDPLDFVRTEFNCRPHVTPNNPKARLGT